MVTRSQGQQTGILFVDSTPISVCHNKHIRRHKTFAGLARHGFKVHVVVNDQGEILAFCLSPGNVDDRVPVSTLVQGLWGKLVGDQGYISQTLFEPLFAPGLTLITTARKNMKNRLRPTMDRVLTRKRALIETSNEQLKNISQIAHTRHRSPCNPLVNLLTGLIAYSWQPNKPSFNLSPTELAQRPSVI